MGTQVLIVEDELIIARDLQQRLIKMGYQVPNILTSGEAAVEQAPHLNPDLILMDIRLGGKLDGVEAARQIGKQLNVPIVYLTAHSDTATLQKVRQTRPYGYILKPFRERELQMVAEIALYHHKLECKLQESEERLAVTLRSIADGVIATNPQGQIIFLNPAAALITGWSQEEANGKFAGEIFGPVPLNNSTPHQTANLPTLPHAPVDSSAGVAAQSAYSEDFLLTNKAGKKYRLAVSSAPIQNETGQSMGRVVVFRDMTLKQQLAEERGRANRLEALGLLAGGLAHDFNNLLTVIIGNLELVQDELAGQETGGEASLPLLEEARKAALMSQTITGQLLTFARGGTPVKKPVNLNEFAPKAFNFALHGSEIKGEIRLDPNLWVVEADAGQIRQVIYNLVLNAIEALAGAKTETRHPGEGKSKEDSEREKADRIGLSAENIELKASSTEGVPLPEGKYVWLKLTDTANGIDPQHLSRIFDPYYTTKKEKGNSGLGLTICHSIISKHNGWLGVESKKGSGTTFSIYLPASPLIANVGIPVSPPAAKAKAMQVFKSTQNRTEKLASKKILVMDDEAGILYLLNHLLTDLGCAVITAKNGQEAVALYRQHQENKQPFDLVMLDLTVVGGMGGVEAFKLLQELNPQIKVIVSSGYSSDAAMANYMQLGFSAVLPKPYHLSEVSQLVTELLLEEY